ncbi:MAG: type II toxin-antitoxin system VapC family toxin [Acidobacteriota bacterium]
MRLAYFDSAVIIKIYVPEADSAAAAKLVQRQKHPLILTRLHELEIRNACRLKQGRGELSSDQVARVFGRVDRDIAQGRLLRMSSDWPEVFHRAEELSARHASECLARSLDVLHVACALLLGADRFYSFDRRQRVLAARAGLRVNPARLPVLPY